MLKYPLPRTQSLGSNRASISPKHFFPLLGGGWDLNCRHPLGACRGELSIQPCTEAHGLGLSSAGGGTDCLPAITAAACLNFIPPHHASKCLPKVHCSEHSRPLLNFFFFFRLKGRAVPSRHQQAGSTVKAPGPQMPVTSRPTALRGQAQTSRSLTHCPKQLPLQPQRKLILHILSAVQLYRRIRVILLSKNILNVISKEITCFNTIGQ